jgi:hypothetical protein
MPVKVTILLKQYHFNKIRGKIRKVCPKPELVIVGEKNIEQFAASVKVGAGKRNALEDVQKNNVANKNNRKDKTEAAWDDPS